MAPVIERLSNAWSAAKKAWQEPTVETANIAASVAIPQPANNTYYVDTLSKAGEELPQVNNGNLNNAADAPYKGRVEYHYEQISADMDAALNQEDRDFEKLQSLIYKVIMLTMRLAAKFDHESIYEINLKIKTQAQEIKSTYNTWQGLTVTVVSAGVSVTAGVAGLTPLFPISVIAAQTAENLGKASQGIGSAGTGLSGIGSIFNNRSEGERQVLQIYLKRSQDSEEERKGSKHSKNDHLKTAKAASEEFARSRYEAFRAAAA